MPLLDSLISKAVNTISDTERQEKWVDTGFDKALSGMRGILPRGDLSPEIEILRSEAAEGLNKLEEHKGDLVLLGANGLRSTLTMVGLGQYETAAQHAALLTLKQSGSWGDVTKAITTTAEAGNESLRALEAARAKMIDVLKSIGMSAAKAVLPFLLALI